ncbi:carbonic anhydrase [Halovulum sp. GXIMD14793]
MNHIKPLPQFYIERYKGWHATRFAENKAWYTRLVNEGQRPRSMVISCCDSRVHVTAIFGAETGDFFIHRNIANLVPPFETGGGMHGTSATLEYAVTVLKVANIMVLGHSQCGGVAGCLDMCSGHAPELEDASSFVGRWMDILKDGYEKVKGIEDRESQLRALEKEGVQVSLNNLMTFPFVRDAVDAGDLALHGLWHDIGTGMLEQLDGETGQFQPV